MAGLQGGPRASQQTTLGAQREVARAGGQALGALAARGPVCGLWRQPPRGAGVGARRGASRGLGTQLAVLAEASHLRGGGQRGRRPHEAGGPAAGAGRQRRGQGGLSCLAGQGGQDCRRRRGRGLRHGARFGSQGGRRVRPARGRGRSGRAGAAEMAPAVVAAASSGRAREGGCGGQSPGKGGADGELDSPAPRRSAPHLRAQDGPRLRRGAPQGGADPFARPPCQVHRCPQQLGGIDGHAQGLGAQNGGAPEAWRRGHAGDRTHGLSVEGLVEAPPALGGALGASPPRRRLLGHRGARLRARRVGA